MNFAIKIVDYVNKLSESITNVEIGRQLTRSAGSVGANFIEAEESLSKKDFVFRVKISRKEAKKPEEESIKQNLIQEATELTTIFGSIVVKSK